jgi:hypothetical protein
MLNLVAAKVVPEGRAASRYAGQDVTETLKFLQRPPTVLATGDSDGLSAEFPFGGNTSLLQMSARESHPYLGNGLFILLEVPQGPSGATNPEAARFALELNERELQSVSLAHFLGSWYPGQRALAFVSFFPNSMHMPGLVRIILEKAFITKSYWVAEEVLRTDTDYERAAQEKARTLEPLATRPRAPE